MALVENPNDGMYKPPMPRGQKVLIIVCSVAMCCALLAWGIAVMLSPDEAEKTEVLQPAPVKQLTKAAENITVPKGAVAATGEKHRKQLNTVIEHRFQEGDWLRHVSGLSDYDVEVTSVHTSLRENGTVRVSYYLDFDNWVGSLVGTEHLPAPFVDACYNKR